MKESERRPLLVEIRSAEPGDVPALFHVRTSVRENGASRETLTALGITEASIVEMISASSCGWVAVANDEIVGFAMVDVPNAALFAAFILPAYEGKGIGTQLVAVAERELFKHHSEIWLETDKRSRAAGFYKRLGWGNERATAGEQIRFTKARSQGIFKCSLP